MQKSFALQLHRLTGMNRWMGHVSEGTPDALHSLQLSPGGGCLQLNHKLVHQVVGSNIPKTASQALSCPLTWICPWE